MMVGMDPERLARLHEIVRAADAYVKRPPAPGETSRSIEFYTDHVGDEGWRLGWELVGSLRETAAGLFASYGEGELQRAALDVVLSAAEPPSVDEVAAALREQATADEGPWLIAMPLANVRLDRPWAPLGPNAAIQRSFDNHLFVGGDPADHEQEESLARSAVRRHLGDYIDPPSRALTIGGTEFDTGRAASITFKEAGPPFVAGETARAKVLYALATWAVLAPPVGWHVMPDLASWTPQPDLLQRTTYKRFESIRWGRTEPRQGGDYRRWAPYALPADDVLTAPFEAFEHLDQRPAQALLSGTAAVHAGSRATRAQISQRLRDVMAAIECLCAPPPGARGTPEQRWDRLAHRFNVWDLIARNRAYTASQIEGLQRRLSDARNISSHRSEAALLDLGWSSGGGRRMRGRGSRPAEDLAFSALHRDIGPLLYAVSEALRKTWAAMRTEDFDDGAFEDLFT